MRLDPPTGLPMVGYVRRWQPAEGTLHPLEATAVVLALGATRVTIVGIDTIGIQSPEADDLRTRVADATGADPAGVILNWSHTHCAPAGGLSLVNVGGPMTDEQPAEVAAFILGLHETVVRVAALAAGRLEPAGAAWGLGWVDEAVNRRERTADGRVILGWWPQGMVDNQVPCLQLRRPDGSAICTVVGYGCHTVTVGPDVLLYSADFPGPMRDLVRQTTGGECVYLQGAAGNVLPRVAFTDDGREADRVGRRLALEALHAVADREAFPRRITRGQDGSVTPFSLYRFEAAVGDVPVLAAREVRVTFPLQPHPSPSEIGEMRREFDAALDAARDEGADEGRLNTLRYSANWARRTQQAIAAGTAPTDVEGSVHAIRIGDGAIVTGPGEVSSEIGMAVRERSPAAVTLYAGYTNGAVSYLPAACSYAHGGYEPGYGNRTYGLPAQVTSECDRILVEASTRLARELFPDAPERGPRDWLASGALPERPPPPVWLPPPM